MSFPLTLPVHPEHITLNVSGGLSVLVRLARAKENVVFSVVFVALNVNNTSCKY